jgi:hypothetical protein
MITPGSMTAEHLEGSLALLRGVVLLGDICVCTRKSSCSDTLFQARSSDAKMLEFTDISPFMKKFGCEDESVVFSTTEGI